ncbi:MAG TPA: hypothetical protein VEO74_10950 [Thermoanaerobaculia bacterium]|nr:hypothetical protein [Thermoanaerobaculia bacterium]
MRRLAAVIPLLFATSLYGQWSFGTRLELRANYRDSKEAKFALKFPFPASFLPVGQTTGFLETVDAGRHTELSVAQLRLDANYGNWFAAHAQLHGQDKYRRNPTSEDRQVDADELWMRVGPKPEFLERPERTSFFFQAGKFPHMERQPTRLLESYGLAATAFNRFEDVGFMGGGSVGRNLYWRLTGTTGNPLYFRDPNALAGDNGIKELLTLNPDPKLKAGVPILYNTETEGYFLRTDHVQFGQGIGYRWQNAAQNLGVDAIVFHYRRSMSDAETLTGTFYKGDIQLLLGPPGFGISIPVSGRRKEESGARLYTEWRGLTATVQFTKQLFAGLHRQGEEIEVGYQIPWSFGPSVGGEALVQGIQPAVRWSALQNDFKGPKNFVDPSMWWNWVKTDYGVRIGLAKHTDITIERAKHVIVVPVVRLRPDETLVTLRVRI